MRVLVVEDEPAIADFVVRGLTEQGYAVDLARDGAAALDLCLVAEGSLDGFIDCNVDAHGVWDYAAGVLICREAGAGVVDAFDRDLVVRDPSQKRTPVAGATPDLVGQAVSARRSFV